MSLSDGRIDPVILSVDPGIATTGYAVFRGSRLICAGKITTSPRDAEPVRYSILLTELLCIMKEHGVTEVALEHFTAFYRNKESSSSTMPKAVEALMQGKKKRKYAHDRGTDDLNARDLFIMKGAQSTVQIASLLHGAKLFLYPVKQWKGDARTSKEEIRRRVKLLYNVEIKNHNITDAVMIGDYHLKFGRLIPGQGTTPPAHRASVTVSLPVTQDDSGDEEESPPPKPVRRRRKTPATT